MISPSLVPTYQVSYFRQTLSTINLYYFTTFVLLKRTQPLITIDKTFFYYYSIWQKTPSTVLRVNTTLYSLTGSFTSVKIFASKNEQLNTTYLTSLTITYSKNLCKKISTLRYAVYYIQFVTRMQTLFTFQYFRFFLTTFKHSYRKASVSVLNLLLTTRSQSKTTNLHRFL